MDETDWDFVVAQERKHHSNLARESVQLLCSWNLAINRQVWVQAKLHPDADGPHMEAGYSPVVHVFS